ncbi:MAG: hypothetical protein IT184_12445 [Acidobacteria bacterium]|nr:hypothetical protein [Acidobacteriota bacterium]
MNRRAVRVVLALAVLAISPTSSLRAAGAGPGPATLSGWQRYVAATEHRRHVDTAHAGSFLVMDAEPGGRVDRRDVLAGQILVRAMQTAEDGDGPVEVPDALVHHWRGAVLVPNVTVPDLIASIERADPPVIQDDVLRSAILERRPRSARVFLRLRRQKIVTVVYDTEHDVTFSLLGATRASSESRAIAIAELRAPGTPQERRLGPGEDRGFLWKLNAYWRYEAVPGGVIAECESISLSRDVPFGLRTVLAPIVASTARESMSMALVALRTRFAR